jgi:long-subunit fatty acid transport protein
MNKRMKVNKKKVVVIMFAMAGLMQSCSTLEFTVEETVLVGKEFKGESITTGVVRIGDMLYPLGGFVYSKDIDINLPLILGFGVNYTPPVKKRFQWGVQCDLAAAASADYVYIKPDIFGRYYLTERLALKGSVGYSRIGTDISTNNIPNKSAHGPTFSLGLTWQLIKDKKSK